MNEQLPPPKKKGSVKKIALIAVTTAAVAAALITWINREAEPSDWKADRSGYQETK